MRDIITLACQECKRRNYSTTKNKKKTTERLELSKFCRFCRKHVPHRETKEPPPSRPWAAEARRGGGGGSRGGEAPRSKKDSSSIGRTPVSKTGGWGFDSLLSCQYR